MDEDRWLKIGQRVQGRPRRHWKDGLIMTGTVMKLPDPWKTWINKYPFCPSLCTENTVINTPVMVQEDTARGMLGIHIYILEVSEKGT